MISFFPLSIYYLKRCITINDRWEILIWSNGIRRYVINVIILSFIQIGMEEHRRHHHKEHHHFPAFPGNSVSGSGWTLDYIRVRSGCSCEIMPKPKKKKIAATKVRRAKSKQRQPRDQELDFETWKYRFACLNDKYIVRVIVLLTCDWLGRMYECETTYRTRMHAWRVFVR